MMDILVSGSVAYDYLMRFPGYFKEHILPDRLHELSLSFLVDSMDRRRGGIAPNIAYNLALFGGKPRLMATVGEDFEEYRQFLEGVGVDTSAVRIIEGDFTASFFVNTDLSNAQIASFYPGAMACAAQLSFHDLVGELPDLAVISPNDPQAMIKNVDECIQLGISYIYDPSQQIVRLDGAALQRGVENSLALFVNDYEFGMIEKKTGLSIDDVVSYVKFVVITHGDHGANVYEGRERYEIPVVPPEVIGDPTGVGDAFRGGFLTGYQYGWNLPLCGRLGALTSTYCIEHKGPQSHSFTRKEFVARFRQHFDDRGVLDEFS
jgi:adenosine kinase